MNERIPTPLSLLTLLVACAACNKAPTEPTAEAHTQAAAVPERQVTAATITPPAPVPPPTPPPPPAKRKVSAKPVASVPPTPGDPVNGVFTLADATKGLKPGKDLVATIETDLGTLKCTLFADKSPITVASFVGVARGLRPVKTSAGTWEKKPAYDGSTFHRIVKGFMIQGGDTNKQNGMGTAGFMIPDEVWDDAYHDRPGLLCTANRGPNTSSDQFFITDAAAPWLDGGYTIFGECGPVDVVHKLAAVPVQGEKPVTMPVMKKITISRQ